MNKNPTLFRALFLSGLFTAALAWTSTISGLSQDNPAPSKPVGHTMALGDYGADEISYLSVPVSQPTVGIVLVPDAYGLDDFTKSEADRLAGLGYLVVAIDIYNGHLTTDPGDLANLTANLDDKSIMKTVNAGIRLFHENPAYRVDHVVAMGWGTGANYVFQAARENKGIDGAITFYGPAPAQPGEITKFAAPLCAVYPEKDQQTTRESVETFQHLMKAAGNQCESWYIAASRGWSNPQSRAHNALEDREAWKVVYPFLNRIAAEPVKPKDGIIDKAKDKIESIFH